MTARGSSGRRSSRSPRPTDPAACRRAWPRSGSTRGSSGPFPVGPARRSRTAVPRLNRYPGRGSARARRALAARHGVPPAQVLVAAGADALIGYVCQAVLEPGDEVVVPWPSFPSFVRDAQKRDADPGRSSRSWTATSTSPPSRRRSRPRTRLLFVATPEQPHRARDAPRRPDRASSGGSRRTSCPVIDEAYFDYLEPEDRLDSIADLVLRRRRRARRCGRSRSSTAWPGLRVGYGVGPAAVVAAMRKVQRGYDVGRARAGGGARQPRRTRREVERRRAANRAAVTALDDARSSREGSSRSPGARRTSCSSTSAPTRTRLAAALLAHGVAVQSGVPFGAPTSVRIGAGSAADLALLDAALGSVGFGAALTPCKPALAQPAGPSAILRSTGARRLFSYADDTQERRRPRPHRQRQRQDAVAAGARRPRSPSTASPSRRRRSRRVARAERSSAGPRPLSSSAPPASPAARTSTSTRRWPPSPRRASTSRRPRSKLDLPIAGQPATALVIGYDRRPDEGKNAPSRSDTLMLDPREPEERDDLAALVPARPPRRDRLPGQARPTRRRSTPPTRPAARAARSRPCASSPASRSTT